MHKEKEAEALFKKEKKRLIKKFGRVALTNIQIDKLCSKELGDKYKGSYAVDDSYERKIGMMIINTDTKNGSGIHWISLYSTPNTVYYYDSFSRSPKSLTPKLVKKFKNKKIIRVDPSDREQLDPENICGHLSISFLLCVKKLGIRKAKLI